MKKKWPVILIVAACMIAFIALPMRASSLTIRITLDPNFPIDANTFYLYYAVDGSGFTEEQVIPATYSEEKGILSFALDSSLAGHLTGLRLDFPNQEQVVGLRDVTVSSAGIVKQRYNPYFLLAPENLKAQNGLYALDRVESRAKAYVGTTPEDPYLVLSDAISLQIARSFSHYRLTRLLLCLFICACVVSYYKKPFKE